jgi:hypothetical protein
MADKVCNTAPVFGVFRGDTQIGVAVTLSVTPCHPVTRAVTAFPAYLSEGDGGDGDTPQILKNIDKNKKYLQKGEKGKSSVQKLGVRERFGVTAVTTQGIHIVHDPEERGFCEEEKK